MKSLLCAGTGLSLAILSAACGEVATPAIDAAIYPPDAAVFDAALPDAGLPDAAIIVDAPFIDAAVTKKVFISSLTFFADMGGTAGADASCQNMANGAGLPGVFRAWVSTAADQVTNRFSHAAVAYALVNGTVVANDWTDLTDGFLDHAIDLTERGTVLPSTTATCHGSPTCAQVFTGTRANGTYIDSQGASCANWTSRVFQPPSGGLITFAGGDSASPITEQEDWTLRAVGFRCDYQARIYCFEQ